MPNQHQDGVSLRPLLKGEEQLSREAIYWHYPHYQNVGTPCSAMRKGDYKLLEFLEDGHLELYHLKTDIGETRNLVEQEPEKARILYDMLKHWRESVDAQMPRKNPNYKP